MRRACGIVPGAPSSGKARATLNKSRARCASLPGAVCGVANPRHSYGYGAIDAFIRAAQKAGTSLTTESFIKAMDTMVIPADIFGSSEAKFGPQKRLGNNQSRLSQLQDARWKVVSDYITH